MNSTSFGLLQTIYNWIIDIINKKLAAHLCLELKATHEPKSEIM